MIKSSVTLATLGIPPVFVEGLRALFAEECDVKEMPADSPSELLDKAGCYLVSAEIFIARLDYFLPRRMRTALFSASSSVPCKETSIPCIRLCDSSGDVMTLLASIFPQDGEEKEDRGVLSAREKEVLVEVASGKTNKEIAEKLFISVNTVITHRKNITSKLGIRSVSGLSVYALMNGLI